MPVSPVNYTPGIKVEKTADRTSDIAAFRKALDNRVAHNEEAGQKSERNTKLIELGTIDRDTPTVSHILKSHPHYAGKCWDIISSSQNKDKQYTQMPEGTVVSLNPATEELVWEQMRSPNGSKAALKNRAAEDRTTPEDRQVHIGTISADNPTVSHLFEAHGNYDRDYWKIIHAPVNKDKNYTTLGPGTEVSLNRSTGELSFNKAVSYKPAVKTVYMERPDKTAYYEADAGNTLADAVKPYIGKSYKNIDCYGLVVRGLINQGVNYHGRGGLREKLEDLAEIHGLPRNAYLNGEGLVEKAGVKIYSKSMNTVSSMQKEADRMYDEITPYLQEGQILSFSTPTRGHTGVISRQGGNWTYINSGLIDNQVTPGTINKRVGEEFLKAEIKNWFSLAADRNESLKVTLGEVHKDRAQDFVMLMNSGRYPGSPI